MMRRGGIRSRVSASSASSANENVQVPLAKKPKCGVRARLQAVETPADDTPFNAAIRDDWASGPMSAPAGLRLAHKAELQGMPNAGRFAKKCSKNPHRDLKRAVGYPSAAPDQVHVDLLDGPEFGHPVFCLIDLMDHLYKRKDLWQKLVTLDSQKLFMKKPATINKKEKMSPGSGWLLTTLRLMC